MLTISEDLFIRYFSGDATAEERRQLLTWVNEKPENERELFILKDIYDAKAYEKLSIEAQTEAEWQKTFAKIKHKRADSKQTKFSNPSIGRDKSSRGVGKPSRGINNIRKYAALFIIGALLGSVVMYFFTLPRSSTPVQVMITKPFEIKTEKGERATIFLPDGSKVSLNACSFLSYSADFGKKTRELTLIGEGYFEVKSNPNMPFTVKTSGLNIKAFGTVFNVRAYSDEDVVQTTLVEGSVSIESDNKIISLKPAQVVTIPKRLIEPESGYTETGKNNVKKDPSKLNNKEETVLIDIVNPEVYTSWIDNKWIIESESLESLAVKIERKYDVTITIENETVKNYVFSGTLKNYPLEQVLETIRLNAPIKYNVNEKNVIISEDKQLKKKYEKLIQSQF